VSEIVKELKTVLPCTSRELEGGLDVDGLAQQPLGSPTTGVFPRAPLRLHPPHFTAEPSATRLAKLTNRGEVSPFAGHPALSGMFEAATAACLMLKQHSLTRHSLAVLKRVL